MGLSLSNLNMLKMDLCTEKGRKGVVRSITAVFLWDALITTVTYSA